MLELFHLLNDLTIIKIVFLINNKLSIYDKNLYNFVFLKYPFNIARLLCKKAKIKVYLYN